MWSVAAHTAIRGNRPLELSVGDLVASAWPCRERRLEARWKVIFLRSDQPFAKCFQ